MKPTPGRNMMDTDMKWYAIVMIAIAAGPAAVFVNDQYQKGQCRIEAIRANMDAEKIAQVCGK